MGDQQEEPVLFYARALYSYQAVEEGEFDFNEADVVSVVEDFGDGWWRAYTQSSIGKVPANYFEVLPEENNQGEGDAEYNYEYTAGGYDYNNNNAGNNSNNESNTKETVSSNPPSQPKSTPSQPPQQSIADSPAYAEQMRCWGDILESQKQERVKLEKQIADSEVQLISLRKEAFYFKQLDFMLQEVLKLETEMDLDLDSSVQYQRTQLAIVRDIKAIKESADSVKLESAHKKHLDEKLEDFNTKINNSLQLLENCDKTRKTFYSDLYSLQSFLEDVEKRKRADEAVVEEERRRQEEEDKEWE